MAAGHTNLLKSNHRTQSNIHGYLLVRGGGVKKKRKTTKLGEGGRWGKKEKNSKILGSDCSG